MHTDEEFAFEKSWRIQQDAVQLILGVLTDPEAKNFFKKNNTPAYMVSVIEKAIDLLESAITADDIIVALNMKMTPEQKNELVQRISALRRKL